MILTLRSDGFAAEARAAGVKRVSVRARALVSLNGRPYAPIVDEKVDLAAEGETWWGTARWIQPIPEYRDKDSRAAD